MRKNAGGKTLAPRSGAEKMTRPGEHTPEFNDLCDEGSSSEGCLRDKATALRSELLGILSLASHVRNAVGDPVGEDGEHVEPKEDRPHVDDLHEIIDDCARCADDIKHRLRRLAESVGVKE